ncbi:DUF4192 domain-containing protein [Lacisediminihabitans profunda]|uniref:DUF4192 domain-containing protein n=1 Tax=Lacisediminihabitans profunda TaxID=2594790 RepID=A0A5C8URG3_9MICO|nr:DUF4192 domain-containing protein [Lacisediminihabitans profunda]TXN31095.1 DUF4192 domain-containing protein [Lacisediminihabitans profunda]
MTFVLKVSGPADVLAMVPGLVGFTPRNSVVLLAFRGTRSCGALRFDLPAQQSKITHKRVATFIVGMLCKLPDVDAVIPVICTDDGFAGGTAIPRREFAELLARRLEFSGFELRDSLCLAADGWASHLAAPPPGGHPLSEIANSPAAAALPDGLGVPASPQERIPDAAPADARRVQKGLVRYRRLYVRLTTEGPATFPDPVELAPLSDIPLFAEEALSWDEDALDAHGALLLFALQGPPVRDHVMLQWATSLAVGDRMWRDIVEDRARDSAADAQLSNLMFGVGPRPEPERIERGIRVLLTLASRVAGTDRLAPLCMLAWLSWALGRGSVAGRYIDEARAIQPDYGMAVVLDTMFSNGLLPEWAFRP